MKFSPRRQTSTSFDLVRVKTADRSVGEPRAPFAVAASVSEAEDLVQDAFLRFERARQSGVEVASPKAYLATTTRLAIDHMRSARVRRESYVGTWLPEPIVADLHESPEPMAELSDSLSMALLVLLEDLSSVERAVFLLREAFDYDYEAIAQIVEKSETNCRQIFAGAKKHLTTHQARYEASVEQSEALLGAFLRATRDGDLGQLVDLLAADAVFCGDGGGKVTAVRDPLHGRDRVAAFLLAIFRRNLPLGMTTEPALVNGGPGVVNRDVEGRIIGVLALEIFDGRIQTVRSVVNPEKLHHLGPVSDFLRPRPDDEETP